MKNLEMLLPSEKETLFQYPAYISLLAANKSGMLDPKDKEHSIHFSHIKTYSCHPLLSDFYHEADKEFEKNITQLNNTLPKDKDERDAAIKNELEKLDAILNKLGKDYAEVMHKSMKSFKDHVSNAHHSLLESFIFPIPIKGLTD